MIGIEVPLNYDLPNNVKFVGYIDIVNQRYSKRCDKDI